MFGSKEKEIVEIKAKPLTTYLVDCITEKRENTNKYSPGHDLAVAIHSDASEEEFKRLLDEFNTENKDFQTFRFQQHLSKNGFYSFTTNAPVSLLVPYQE